MSSRSIRQGNPNVITDAIELYDIQGMLVDAAHSVASMSYTVSGLEGIVRTKVVQRIKDGEDVWHTLSIYSQPIVIHVAAP